jgi:hypothetical protein
VGYLKLISCHSLITNEFALQKSDGKDHTYLISLGVLLIELVN